MTNGTPDDDAAFILASGSVTRAGMLTQAGLDFGSDPANIDEESVKASLRAEGASASALADTLAELKALTVSRRHTDALVLGADQVLEFEGRWLDKPKDRADARDNLQMLRGKSHRLVSAAVMVQDGERIWGRTDFATLQMRDFSDDFLETYLERAGEAVTTTVGGYQLEGVGAQLFVQVEGDFFTVLGLPLLPLLDFLRGRGVIPA